MIGLVGKRGVLRRRTALRLVVALAGAAAIWQVPAAAAAGSVRDLLPDLRMALPSNVYLDRTDGHFWLRFDTIMENVGEGPLDLRSTRRCPDCKHMNVVQSIERSDGSARLRTTVAKQRYDNSDNHHHWHVIGMERYELLPLDAPFPDGQHVGHKRGFCFFDGLHSPDPSVAERASWHFDFFSCGTPDSQALNVGMSVGWADIYPWNFTGQFIDLASVPKGRYLVCLTADPQHWFSDLKPGNNQTWFTVKIPSAAHVSTDNPVQIEPIDQGRRQCRTQLPYTPSMAAPPAQHSTDGKMTGTSPVAAVQGAALAAPSARSTNAAPARQLYVSVNPGVTALAFQCSLAANALT